MIYLDNNASTPVDPEVSDAVFSSLRREYGNPSSSHDPGRRAHDQIESCRRGIAGFVGCAPDEIIFTSGGTESNNLAILGLALHRGKGHIVTSAIEHPSVSNVCRHLEQQGFSVSRIGTDHEGIVDLDALRRAVTGETFLISVMHANNETGVIQPVEEIARIAREHAVVFHCDAAQTVGKIPFSLESSGIDMLTLASHKFYGPKGIGALCIKKGVVLSPILYGAGHELGLRPGTENVAGIAGFAAACRIAGRDIKLRVSHTARLSAMLLESLGNDVPGIRLNGHETLRLPNTLNISIPGVPAGALIERLGMQVALSAGSACHAANRSPSVALKSMGLTDEQALTSIRISVGKDNTEEEIGDAAVFIADAVREIRKISGYTILS
jgi:cysteine desulfurase